MTINKEKNGSELVLTLEGRLDTTTAPMLEKELKQEIGGVNLLIMNFAGVEYISSAGLERERGGEGKRGDFGGRRILKKKKKKQPTKDRTNTGSRLV